MNIIWNQRVIAAISMALLSLCAITLIVGAIRTEAGTISFLAVGLAVVTVATLVRAWQLGRKRGSLQVLSTKPWKWLVFIAAALGSCVYAALAITTQGNLGVGGILMLLIANLIPMLLFEAEPRPAA